MKIGRLTISDRVSAGIYSDASGPEIEKMLRDIFPTAAFESFAVPDEMDSITTALKRFADDLQCELIVTTGGTGITLRDITPEATRLVIERELPGFGEAMRMQSFAKIKTAILSRGTAGTRKQSLIINLPGKPSAVRECLQILAPAIREGIEHLHGRDPHQVQP